MLAFFPFAPYAVQQEAISFLKCCVASKTPAFLDAPTGTGKTAILFHLAWDWISSLEKSADTSSRAESMQSNVSFDRSNIDGLPAWAVDAGEKAIVESVMASRNINRAFVKQLLQVAEAYGAPDALNTLLECVSRERRDHKLFVEPSRKQTPINPYSFLFAFLGLDKTLSPDTYLSLTKLNSATSGQGYSEDSAVGYMSKGHVVLSTRTHAQLTQIVDTFRRSSKIVDKQSPQLFDFSTAPVVSLAGRDMYCLHSSPETDLEDLGELCEELRRNSKCSHYHPAKLVVGAALCLSKTHAPLEFRSRCNSLGVCPYYSARHAAMHASVVLLSHVMLVEELSGAPGSLGLLKPSPLLLLVDEAHALPGAVEARNSCTASEEDLGHFIQALNNYLLRVRSGLPGSTARLLDRLAAVMGVIKKSLDKIASYDALVPVSEVLSVLRLKGFDFNEALNILLVNSIPQKLCTYCKDLEMTGRPRQRIYSVVSIIRVLAETDVRDSYMAYVVGEQPKELHLYRFSSLANSSTKSPFRRLFSTTQGGRRYYDAQICFVSGTLTPFSHYSRELLGQPAIATSCCSIDHVAAPSRTLVQQISFFPMAGEQKKALFVASSWTPEQVDTVFRTIMKIAGSCKDCTGTLVFLPSYRVVEKIRELYLAFPISLGSGPVPTAFFERAGEPVDKLMEAYTLKLKDASCVLFASAGGRVSEGLDFKDNLCRRLVVVGIPFPNMGDPVIREKHKQSGGQFFMDHAFTLINQCLGRGVRHKDDWCSFLLFDSRFAEHASRLSRWIRDRMQITEDMDTAVEGIKKFEARFT